MPSLRARAFGYLLAVLPGATLGAPLLKGDLDGSGSCDLHDFALMLRVQTRTLALGSLGADQRSAADVAPFRGPGRPPGGDGVDAADTWLFVRAFLLQQDLDGDGDEAVGGSPFDDDSDDDGVCDQASVPSASCASSEAAEGTLWYDADTDDDGLCDGTATDASLGCDDSELARGSSGTSADTDGDGLCDGFIDVAGACAGAEAALGTNPRDVDSDGDTLCDGRSGGPRLSDSRGNVCDGGELEPTGVPRTNPLDADSDGDGLCDSGFQPSSWSSTGRVWNSAGALACEGAEDQNHNSAYEPGLGETNPLEADSNGNRIGDFEELVDLSNVPCPNCFAVAVLPDTQTYTVKRLPYAGDEPLKLIGRTLCSRRSQWREPGTGKTMPISMVIQLGDLTESGDVAEWARISALFDELDACPNPADPAQKLPVPYLVVSGNHDVMRLPGEAAGQATYWRSLRNFNRYFAPPCIPSSGGPPKACEQPANPNYQPTQNPLAFEPENFGAPDSPRSAWRDHFCPSPPHCTASQWFLGNGDDVRAFSRGNRAGPAVDEPGRHRAGVIQTPNGTRFLFIGLDLGFDFPNPTLPAGASDDLAWTLRLMDQFGRSVPTILFHHEYFLRPGVAPPADFGSDYGAVSWTSNTQEAWNHLLGKSTSSAPPTRPQVGMTWVGHWDFPGYAERGAQLDGVERLYRDYQWRSDPAGWIVMAVFDPDAARIRIRSYRVDDEENYRTRWMVRHGLAPVIDHAHKGSPEIDRHMDRDNQCASGYATGCELELPWLW